jgi:hypothetical protein
VIARIVKKVVRRTEFLKAHRVLAVLTINGGPNGFVETSLG